MANDYKLFLEDWTKLTGTGEETFIVTVFAFLGVMLVWLFVSYILSSLALYKMSKNTNLDDMFVIFSWIPTFQLFTMGKLMDGYSKIPNMMVVFPAVTLGGSLLMQIPFIGVLLIIPYIVFSFYAFHILFKRYSEKALIMTIFNVITFGILASLFMFVIRNKKSL